MGNPQRIYQRQLELSLFDREATYDAGPGAWTSGSACSMLDFDPKTQDDWPDVLGSNEGQVGRELASRIEIVRQDVKIPYAEAQAKPNSLAGLLALNLGTVASTQDGAVVAYRHKITKAVSYSLPSIGAQMKHEGGRQYKYTGLKGDGYTLAMNADYLRLDAPLLGSGTRSTAADAFAAAISENPLLWANAKNFVKATSGAISIPAIPVQGAANLGGSEVNLSTRILDFSHAWTGALAGPAGYRAGSNVRQNLKAGRRSGVVKFGLEVDVATEAAELDYYLNQSKVAVELNIDSGTIIANTGVFKYGLIVIIPQIQFKTIGKNVEGEYEKIDYDGTIMDDGTNSEVVIFVYDAQTTYLA